MKLCQLSNLKSAAQELTARIQAQCSGPRGTRAEGGLPTPWDGTADSEGRRDMSQQAVPAAPGPQRGRESRAGCSNDSWWLAGSFQSPSDQLLR